MAAHARGLSAGDGVEVLGASAAFEAAGMLLLAAEAAANALGISSREELRLILHSVPDSPVGGS